MERGPLNDEEITSPDPSSHGVFQKLDGGAGDGLLSPVSSMYSSCGESEFDRYCSANSVMGTPSMCSSMGFYHDFGDSDIGSLKGLEGFSLGSEKSPRRFEERPRSLLSGQCDEEGSNSSGGFEGRREVVEHGGSSSSCHGSALDGDVSVLGRKSEGEGVKVFNAEAGNKEDLAVLLKNVENVLLQGAVAARSAAETLFDCNHADEMEDERCREEDEASSRYEHSDSEDSMFKYGSDAGSQPNTYYPRNVESHHDDETESGNMMLMNQSVAFGSKDWEEFELSGGDDAVGSQISDNLWEQRQAIGETETTSSDCTPMMESSTGNLQWQEQERVEKLSPVDNLQRVGNSLENSLSCSTANVHSLQVKEAEDTSGTCKPVQSNDRSDEYLESCSVDNVYEKHCHSSHVVTDMSSMEDDKYIQDHGTTSDHASNHDDHPVVQELESLPGNEGGETSFASLEVHSDLRLNVLEGSRVESSEGHMSNSVSSWADNDKARIHDASNLYKDEITTNIGKDLELNEFYDELVHEMEEILLDSSDLPLARSKQRNAENHSEQLLPLRDGGSTASTSGLDNGYPLIPHPFHIDGIEVVGAKQKKGDISLSERLVGVKGYTVYVIRVWSGNYKWEVERRYRDFYSLYCQLKTLFASQGWNLPPAWSSVEQESRKFFGNGSPNVIAVRSSLIQECLCSLLQSRLYSSLPSPLIWFLSPPENLLHASQSNHMVPQPTVGAHERVSSFGKKISLIVDIRPQKSVKELLDRQHYKCAGCHSHFDNGKNRVLDIVQTFGWGKPRLCEYTGQLFCSSCHTNDSAVLPARVLHHWDFTPYPVSQLAKSYLDSIIDQPMLCVSAANPFLFSRVPALLHVVGIRRKIGAMLPCIRCSFRRSIYRRLGYRKYLLETTDFFALRDLIDLSKGAFAALPALLEAVLKKVKQHITELCLECCDSGVPCGARQACENPSSLIFPFQEEEEIQRCKSCEFVFHKHCFNKLVECPCGAVFKAVDAKQSITKLRHGDADAVGANESPISSGDKSEFRSSVGLLYSIFSGKTKEHKESDNVILMGSLPGNSL